MTFEEKKNSQHAANTIVDITTSQVCNMENGHPGTNFNFSTQTDKLVLGRFDQDINIDANSKLILIYSVANV